MVQEPNAIVAVCDYRSPQGFGPVITLYADRLVLQSRGMLGGGKLDDIPLAALRGFYVYNTQYVRGGQSVGQAFGQFLIAWTDASGKRRVAKWVIDVDPPPFRALLQELARLRPDASFGKLPVHQAHRALGLLSPRDIKLITVLVIVLFLVILFVALLH
jgi:hypothetical protein